MAGPEAGELESVAQTASLALADTSLPLWFKPELFVQPGFSPTAYVADLKRYVSAQGCSSACWRAWWSGGAWG